MVDIGAGNAVLQRLHDLLVRFQSRTLCLLQDAALVKTSFATSNMQMFMACWDRENILVLTYNQQTLVPCKKFILMFRAAWHQHRDGYSRGKIQMRLRKHVLQDMHPQLFSTRTVVVYAPCVVYSLMLGMICPTVSGSLQVKRNLPLYLFR